MWTMCVGGANKSPTPSSITVNELTRDVYVCGEINIDTTTYYQEYFLGRYSQHGTQLSYFTMGTEGNHGIDYCLDVDVAENADGYVFSCGTIMDDGGMQEAIILRVNPDLSDPLKVHWGGRGTNDVAFTLKVNDHGSMIFIMGYTNSFSDQDDYDHFMMKVNSDLE